MCVSVWLCVTVCVFVSIRVCVTVCRCVCPSESVCVCMCICMYICVHVMCGDITGVVPRGRGLPVHGYLPAVRFGHRHPLQVSLVVGGVHPDDHHHAALLVAERGGRRRAHCEGRVMGGFSQAQHHARSSGLRSSVITCPHITQPTYSLTQWSRLL